MSIPSINTNITPLNTYPDRVSVNYRYRLSHGIDAQTLCTRLQAIGFNPVGSGEAYSGTIEVEGIQSRQSVFISYSRRGRVLNCYTRINALTELNARSEHRNSERAINGDTNWLFPSDIEEDNSPVITVASALIDHVGNHLWGVFQSINGSEIPVDEEQYLGCTVSRLETTIDFACNDPAGVVHAAGESFHRHFQTANYNGYRDTANVFESLEGNVPMYHGYYRVDERYKFYPKSNLRVRLECEIKDKAFRRMGISRTLERHEDGFVGMYRAVAEQVVPHFTTFIGDLQEQPDVNHTPVQFLARLGRAIRDPDEATRLALILAREGRIRSDGNSRILARLNNQGLLQRTDLGQYAVAPEWRNSVRCIANMEEANLGFLLGVAV